MSLGKNIKKQKLIPEEVKVPTIQRGELADRSKRHALRSRYQQELVLLKGAKLQLIVFWIGKNQFALQIKQAQEVLVTPTITPSPYYPKSVRGVMEVRGTMVVALDLERKFGYEDPNANYSYTLLIKSSSDQNIGILLREVPLTMKVDGATLMSASGLMSDMAQEETYIIGVVKSGNDLIYMLDIEELIANEQIPAT